MLKEIRSKKKELIQKNGGVAQLGEHLPCKQGVKSSNLSISTHLKRCNRNVTGDDSMQRVVCYDDW